MNFRRSVSGFRMPFNSLAWLPSMRACCVGGVGGGAGGAGSLDWFGLRIHMDLAGLGLQRLTSSLIASMNASLSSLMGPVRSSACMVPCMAHSSSNVGAGKTSMEICIFSPGLGFSCLLSLAHLDHLGCVDGR